MCRPIAWLVHLISAVGAINWGLVKFFQFNLVDYIVATAQVAYLSELLYATVMICGILSVLALFSPGSCKKS